MHHPIFINIFIDITEAGNSGSKDKQGGNPCAENHVTIAMNISGDECSPPITIPKVAVEKMVPVDKREV